MIKEKREKIWWVDEREQILSCIKVLKSPKKLPPSMNLKKIFLFFQKNLLTKCPPCAIISMYQKTKRGTKNEI